MVEDLALRQTRRLTEALGIRGWTHLDAVLLAALATESPLLLVGPHGTAKSLLVERIAHALRLPFRHYNAALLNYDDLVGIPMPDEEGKTLQFVTTPGTIWGAGFVFFDEISRCRADLQNKLFPIIHERRVVGMDLDDLAHRWAAMNPPAPEEPQNPRGFIENTLYIGSEPLDPALTDRFPFVIPVPGWGELDKEDRRCLVYHSHHGYSADATDDLPDMVTKCAQLLASLEDEFGDWLGDYVVGVLDLLAHAGLPQSPRRAAMLARSVVAVHGARIVLEGEDVDPEESAETALIYGIPQNATDVPPARVRVIALHKQAWEIVQNLEDDSWRQVMEEYDPALRVALADQLGFDDSNLSRLVTQAIGTEDSDARQIGLGTAMFLAFKERRNLDPSAFEPLAQLAYHVLEPREVRLSMGFSGVRNSALSSVVAWLEGAYHRQDTAMFRLQRNFLLQGIAGLWEKYDWKEALGQFREDLALFGIEENAQ